MIKLVDIKKAINDVLAPVGLKTYGNEVKEGFLRPCFFIGVTLRSERHLQKGYQRKFLDAGDHIFFSQQNGSRKHPDVRHPERTPDTDAAYWEQEQCWCAISEPRSSMKQT